MSGKTAILGRRRYQQPGSVVAALALVAGLAIAAAPPASASAKTHVSIIGFSGAGGPKAITADPNGTVWFTSEGSQSIVRISKSGLMTSFTGKKICDPAAITFGSDGALWFASQCGAGSIGRMTVSGTVTEYTGAGTVGVNAMPPKNNV